MFHDEKMEKEKKKIKNSNILLFKNFIYDLNLAGLDWTGLPAYSSI